MNTRFSVDHFCCNSNLCVSAPAISIHCKQVQANNRIKSNFCSFSLFWNLQAISHHFMILQVKFNLTVSCSRKQINFQQPSWTATARCGTGNLLLSPATSGGVDQGTSGGELEQQGRGVDRQGHGAAPGQWNRQMMEWLERIWPAVTCPEIERSVRQRGWAQQANAIA